MTAFTDTLTTIGVFLAGLAARLGLVLVIGLILMARRHLPLRHLGMAQRAIVHTEMLGERLALLHSLQQRSRDFDFRTRLASRRHRAGIENRLPDALIRNFFLLDRGRFRQDDVCPFRCRRHLMSRHDHEIERLHRLNGALRVGVGE